MAKVEITRNLLDLYSTVAAANMLKISQKYMAPKELMHEEKFLNVRKEISSFWVVPKTYSPRMNPTSVEKIGLDAKRAMGKFCAIAKENCFSGVNFHEGEKILVSKGEISFPKEAYSAILMWHRFSQDEGFAKDSGCEGFGKIFIRALIH